jgi:DNA polymerase III gamma/tau subunit
MNTAHPYLKLWAENKGVTAPLLLTGATTKLTAETLALTQALLCPEKAGEACGKCVVCQQVAKQIHPDVVTLPLADKHGIKQLRDLFDTISRRPLHGRRVVILHNIEYLSVPAANALLKTLEEPSVTTRFILTTPFPRRVLPTILSRCERIAVGGTNEAPPENVDIIKQLRQAKTREELTDTELEQLARYLQQALRARGPTPELRRAFMRLRDYHRIRSVRGNEKLAREVLVASLPSNT